MIGVVAQWIFYVHTAGECGDFEDHFCQEDVVLSYFFDRPKYEDGRDSISVVSKPAFALRQLHWVVFHYVWRKNDGLHALPSVMLKRQYSAQRNLGTDH